MPKNETSPRFARSVRAILAAVYASRTSSHSPRSTLRARRNPAGAPGAVMGCGRHGISSWGRIRRHRSRQEEPPRSAPSKASTFRAAAPRGFWHTKGRPRPTSTCRTMRSAATAQRPCCTPACKAGLAPPSDEQRGNLLAARRDCFEAGSKSRGTASGSLRCGVRCSAGSNSRGARCPSVFHASASVP